MAYHDLVINARLPQGVQFLMVSPGEARFLEQKVNDRVPGGTRLTIPDFGTTAMILCTTDMDLCRRIESFVQRIRPRPPRWRSGRSSSSSPPSAKPRSGSMTTGTS